MIHKHKYLVCFIIIVLNTLPLFSLPSDYKSNEEMNFGKILLNLGLSRENCLNKFPSNYSVSTLKKAGKSELLEIKDSNRNIIGNLTIYDNRLIRIHRIRREKELNIGKILSEWIEIVQRNNYKLNPPEKMDSKKENSKGIYFSAWKKTNNHQKTLVEKKMVSIYSIEEQGLYQSIDEIFSVYTGN